jgi:hypothetical protein
VPSKKAAAPAEKATALKAAPQVTITLKQMAAELAEAMICLQWLPKPYRPIWRRWRQGVSRTTTKSA